MAGRWTRSLQLFKECFATLRREKEMLLFPLFSGIFCLVVIISFLLPFYFNHFTTFNYNETAEPTQESLLFYVYGFIFYVVSYFVIYFFNTAMVICAAQSIKGNKSSFKEGITGAFSKIDRIFAWALFSATVGLLLRILESISERLKIRLLASIVIALFGIAWTLATYFVIPIMILEDKKPFAAVKKSTQLFKKTWGESVIGQVGLEVIMWSLFLCGFLLLFFAGVSLYYRQEILALWMVIAACAYWVFLVVMNSALRNIFVTVLYFYASSGTIASGFSPESIQNVWVPKKLTGNI